MCEVSLHSRLVHLCNWQEPQAGLEPDFLWSGPCLEALIWLTEHCDWWIVGGKQAEAVVSQSLWETNGKSSSIWENL